MDEELKNFQLPKHKITSSHQDCSNTKPGEIEEDVGLTTAICPTCKSPFVFNKTTLNWMPEDEFEKNLKTHSVKLLSFF